MIEAMIAAGAAIIVGVLSLIGVMASNKTANNKIQQELKVSQAVTDEKISELTREVRMHNDFAKRIPVIEEQVKVINHRINDLEEYHKQK